MQKETGGIMFAMNLNSLKKLSELRHDDMKVQTMVS